MSSVETGQGRRHEHSVVQTNESDAEAQSGSRRRRRRWVLPTALVCVLAIAGALAAATSAWWLPHVRMALGSTPSLKKGTKPDTHDHTVEADTGHNHASLAAGSHGQAGDDSASLQLSAEGRKNIGLTLATVQLRDFERTISVPATLVAQSGRTELAVSAPMTGIVKRIYPIRGEAVSPGDSLFDLRMTHEDLVEKQSNLLRSLEELDVVKREVARLEEVTASGAIAGKRVLERQYEQQKIEAAIRAERQALLLHGLAEDQIQQIVDKRQLLQQLTIFAPPMAGNEPHEDHEAYLQVAQLPIELGEHVTTGTRLATLTDHCELYIEGKAFAQDADALNQAANAGLEVTARIDGNGSGDREVTGLRILYVENQVGRESRALKFYLRLPNELTRNEQTPDGHRFIGWRYRPGQRVELLVPVERWERRIVLPVEAVVQEGAESYVYQEIKGHFDRRRVHVQYRDQRFAVIQADGSLFPGEKVAAKGAYQIHLALKNQAGGGSDPHAGHHH